MPGIFQVYRKYEQTRMTGADYDTPDVPWTMYYSGGFAIHGAYWHNNFGTPVSHGCVNLRVPEAKALYEWAAMGTEVVVTSNPAPFREDPQKSAPSSRKPHPSRKPPLVVFRRQRARSRRGLPTYRRRC